MTKFRTHLIVGRRDSSLIQELDYSSYGFKLELSTEPTGCYWETENGKGQMFYSDGKDFSRETNENEFPQNELIVIAENIDIAEDILSIIKGGSLLAFPTPTTTAFDFHLTEFDDNNVEYYKAYPSNFRKLDSIGFACQVLERVYNNDTYSYALEKLKVSLSLNSFNPISADPIYGQVHQHYSVERQIHTHSAFAIIASFSVIEELGLEVRSSSKNPRFIDNETGEWNPKVLSNINKRLEKIGIEKTDTFDWIYRGQQTEVEKDFKPYFGIDSKWTSYGEIIRDKTLTFPEAIHNASYLRNFIASHKFKDLTKYISPYDVHNVQILSRKLIIQCLGMWEIMMNRNKTMANNGYN